LAYNEPKTVYWLNNTLYLNITNQCSNCCYFCFKNYRIGVGGFNLKLLSEPTIELIEKELSDVLHTKSWDGIVFCGFGEPTERLDVLLEVTKWIKLHFSKTIQIRLDTNGHGYALNPGRNLAIELKNAGIEKVSVSLNAEDKETYIEICKPTLPEAYEAVLDFIQKTKKLVEVEVTAVRVPEVDLAIVQEVAEKLGVKFKIREYIPCFY
jgi:TatD DNase family protein